MFALINRSLLLLLLVAAPAYALEEVVLSFAVKGYTVVGNTLLPQTEVDTVLEPYTGANKNFGDVQQALEALESRYRNAGFSAVQVILPEQELNQGMVQLRVVEAHIGNIGIEGNEHFDEENIRYSLPHLRAGDTPNARAVARNLRIINESPAKNAQVTLKATDDDEIIDAEVKVAEEKAWKAFISFDNTGTQETGKGRIGFGYQHANLWNSDHVLTLQYVTSTSMPENVSIYSLGYRIPFYEVNKTLDIFAAYADTSAATALAIPGLAGGAGAGIANSINSNGKVRIVGARLNHYFEHIGSYEHKLALGIDSRDFFNSSSPLIVGDPAIHRSYKLTPVSLGYDGSLKGETSETSFYVSLASNIPDRGKNGDNAAFRNAKPCSPGAGGIAIDCVGTDYKIVRYGATFAKAIPGDWQLRATLSGQYTPDALMPGEQFGLGGASSVRGFTERERANDNGYQGSLELYSPDLAGKLGLEKGNVRALLFYDAGFGWDKAPSPDGATDTSLASIGAGIRFGIGKSFSMKFDYAHVLDGNSPSISNAHVGNDNRGHVAMGYVF